jgi:hypothetical protein
MTAAKNMLRQMAEKAADDRAHRIASIAAEELIRCEGDSVGPDEYVLPQCFCDDHVLDCIDHLKWHGEAVSFETEDGYIKVIFGDFTLDSLAAQSGEKGGA